MKQKFIIFYVSKNPMEYAYFSEIESAIDFCDGNNIPHSHIIQYEISKAINQEFLVTLLNDLSPFKKIHGVTVKRGTKAPA